MSKTTFFTSTVKYCRLVTSVMAKSMDLYKLDSNQSRRNAQLITSKSSRSWHVCFQSNAQIGFISSHPIWFQTTVVVGHLPTYDVICSLRYNQRHGKLLYPTFITDPGKRNTYLQLSYRNPGVLWNCGRFLNS